MIAKRVEYNGNIYFQSFNGHIEDGLRILLSYFETKQSVMQSFCSRWRIDIENFRQDLFLTVALHDIGKLTEQFQKNIEAGRRSHRYPHPLFGIPVLLEIPFNQYENFPLPVLAILGHHSQLHKAIYQGGHIERKVKYLDKQILDFVNIELSQLYQKLGFSKYFSYTHTFVSTFQHWDQNDILEDFIKKYCKQQFSDCHSVKAIYTYLLSILQLCDDYSSAHFSHFVKETLPHPGTLDSVITDTTQFVYDIELRGDSIKDNLFGAFTPYKFQNDLYNSGSKFSFLFAPCGRGKTEAALWWAFRLKETLRRDKIIFALPTQVTCNAMYDRLLDKYKFEKKDVGLFHGKGLIALKYRQDNISTDEFESPENNDFKSYDILRDEVFKGNVFFKPITVTTIDHLAYSLVHGFSQADFACGNLQNAIIIFDEVHYYEKETLNILLRQFQILRKMSIPHLLMTGTAPEFLLKEIRNNYEIIEDIEGLAYQPFTISKKNEFLSDQKSIIESIIEDYKQGKNVFVILNQVEWTQNFFTELLDRLKSLCKKPNIILYHSRFIHKHRVKKEKDIREAVKQKPCILVTTQVIEISLDITCDVMYTTIAPPDAIGQRAGRINRSGKHYKNGFTYEVKLFSIESHLPYSEEIIQDSWKCFNETPYSYMDIKNVCDEVYKNHELAKDIRYNNFYKNNILFGEHHKNIAYNEDEGKALKIRPDNFQQINVIPSRVYDETQQLVHKNEAVWAEYEVRIPYYKLQNDRKEHGELYNFHIREDGRVIECDYEYDYCQGIQFKDVYKRTEFV